MFLNSNLEILEIKHVKHSYSINDKIPSWLIYVIVLNVG